MKKAQVESFSCCVIKPEHVCFCCFALIQSVVCRFAREREREAYAEVKEMERRVNDLKLHTSKKTL